MRTLLGALVSILFLSLNASAATITWHRSNENVNQKIVIDPLEAAGARSVGQDSIKWEFSDGKQIHGNVKVRIKINGVEFKLELPVGTSSEFRCGGAVISFEL